MKNRLLSILFLSLISMTIMADAVGTWKLYPCYNNVTDIVPAGKDIFVLASGNLYSYNTNDNSIQTYTKNDVLNNSNIQHIAWASATKKLVITYSDYTIDILSLNGDVDNISAIADKEITGDKTINSIYVNGQYAYLSTGLGIIKLNTKDATLADTYNLGYSVKYCYIDNGNMYAASESNGLMCCSLTANLLNKNEWTHVGSYTPQSKDQYIYDATNNCYWAVDSENKLTKYEKTNGSYNALNTGVKPDGPSTNYFWRLLYNNGYLYCADGQYNVETVGAYNRRGNVKKFDGQNWTELEKNIVTDLCSYYNTAECVAVDPKNSSHVFVGAVSGLYEFLDDKFTKYYDKSSFAESNGSSSENIIASMCFDSNGNLWLASYKSPYIAKLSQDGTWTKYDHSDLLNGNYNNANEGTFIDSRGLIWFCSTRYSNGRLFCYNPTTDVLKRYDDFVNQDGSTYSPWFRTLAEDNNGNVWIATSVGPFYVSKSDIADNNSTMTQYKVPRNDGTNYADYLLSGVDISSIVIDKANRKWMGTKSNGIYVISSDCNTEINHFTTDNSPLPSDGILDIEFDTNTGTIYIATENGLCSYQSDITSNYGEMTKDNVYAYPNPVSPDFTGDITIVGLTNGAQIKILTASGQLVNEGTCSGGSYQWDGCDLNGKKVASGVYMVNVATSEGTSGTVTKIGIIR